MEYGGYGVGIRAEIPGASSPRRHHLPTWVGRCTWLLGHCRLRLRSTHTMALPMPICRCRKHKSDIHVTATSFAQQICARIGPNSKHSLSASFVIDTWRVRITWNAYCFSSSRHGTFGLGQTFTDRFLWLPVTLPVM